VESLQDLDKFYENSSVESKRHLAGMLFPQNLTYLEGGCRTACMNEASELIPEKQKLRPKKIGQNLFSDFASGRSAMVRNSNHFIEELIEIGDF
jgi:hypothetical protein